MKRNVHFVRLASHALAACLVLAMLAMGMARTGEDANGGNDYEAEYVLRLWDQPEYEGEMMELRVWVDIDSGEYKVDANYLGNAFWNKSRKDNKTGEITSIGPEKDEKYKADWWLFDGTRCRGDAMLSGNGRKKFVGDSVSDRTSSYRFAVDPEWDWCYFYPHQHRDWKGQSVAYKLYAYGNSYDYVLEISDLSDHWNDYVSSIETWDQQSGNSIGVDYEWHFFKDHHYHGGRKTLANGADADELGSFNNKISSIRLIIDE